MSTILPLNELIKKNDLDNWKNAIFSSVGIIKFTETETGNTFTGTGTLVTKEVSEEGIKIYLITNKHVLPNFEQSKRILFDIHIPWLENENKFISLDIDIYDEENNYLPHVQVNKEGIDVAVLDVTVIFVDNSILHQLISNLPPLIYFADDVFFNERNITIGDDAFFIGYPSYFYHKKNSTPLLRNATIATNPKEIYYFNEYLENYFKMEKLDGFLIDAHVFGGSSGSLLFLKPQLVQMYDGQIMFSSQKNVAVVIGIVTFSFPSINAIDQSQKLALGGVIKSQHILNTINQF